LAIAAEAVPAPITMSRPRGRAGRKSGTRNEGCAIAIAALNILFIKRSASSSPLALTLDDGEEEIESFIRCPARWLRWRREK
jgi:hypothetical protein